MSFYNTIIKPILFLFKPEAAHNLSILALKLNLLPKFKTKVYKSLKVNIFGLNFKNPVGLAAGYDKNAEVFFKINNFGFGFIECGTVTPKAQKGNAKPRLFRLKEDKAIINKMGFNNLGVNIFLNNIKKQNILQTKHISTKNKNCDNEELILGINIGKNKDTIDELEDYLICLEKLYKFSSYITVNISSPNTKNLRNIQKNDILENFLHQIVRKKILLAKKHNQNKAILLKIAPDLSDIEIENIAKICLKERIDGVIISNTTINLRLNLKSKFKNEMGGLSGKPLLDKSNEVLKIFYQKTFGKIPIIGVGGISCANDAYKKIKLGASLVQIYSALIYDGFYMIEEIKKELDFLVKKDGFTNISQAIGVDNKIQSVR